MQRPRRRPALSRRAAPHRPRGVRRGSGPPAAAARQSRRRCSSGSTVSVGKTPYVRFDLNDYSIPHTHVRRVLTLLADPHEVRIVDGAEVLACHRRSYDKGAQIEDAAHVQSAGRAEARRSPASRHGPPRAGGPRQPDPADRAPPNAAPISAPSPPP